MLLALILLPCLLQGQGQVYTRKARLEDFSTRTTKIVLSGLPMFDIVLKEEVSSRWRISPYEFCTFKEYERYKNRNLYYFMRFGFRPAKVFMLAQSAFGSAYDTGTIKKWLTTFCRRFFSQQFKRSCLPDGPNVGSVSLSPRGDWRMPSDASSAIWLKECEEL